MCAGLVVHQPSDHQYTNHSTAGLYIYVSTITVVCLPSCPPLRSGVPELGVDRLASGDFMQLLGGRYQAKGLTDSSQYNAFLVLVEPADKLAAMVLKVASATQVSSRGWGRINAQCGRCQQRAVPSMKPHA